MTSTLAFWTAHFCVHTCTLKINDSTFYISNIYAPNNGRESKSFFNAINDPLFEYTDDSDKNYSLILGDFNCTIQKDLDRNPPQQLADISVREYQKHVI